MEFDTEEDDNDEEGRRRIGLVMHWQLRSEAIRCGCSCGREVTIHIDLCRL